MGSAIRSLTAADLPAALTLSASAQWNQNEADWRAMLALGQGVGIDGRRPEGPSALAASTVMLPYGGADDEFAWISMVLVLPDFRRQGLAQTLLRHALQTLQAAGRSAVLDATPAGHAVYVQEGFADTWGFARYRLDHSAMAHASASTMGHQPSTVRALREADWCAIDALDSPTFGASRLALLQRLAQRQPASAHVCEDGGRITGFVLARDGREASQVGPLLAASEPQAAALLRAALAPLTGTVYVDALDRRQALLTHLQGLGFVRQRPFTRMVHGRTNAPGDAGALMLVTGPEWG